MSQVRFSLRTVAIVVAGLATVFWLVQWKLNQVDEPTVYHRAKSNLRKVSSALLFHKEANGLFPSDQRGPNYSLFKIHNRVNASVFEVTAKGRAQWDLQRNCLVDGQIRYLNRAEPPEHSVILETALLPMDIVCYCTIEQAVGHVESGGDPPDLLGNFETVDGFLVVGSEVFSDWCLIHPFLPCSVTETEIEYDIGLKIGFTYDGNGHLSRCVATLGDMSMIETIATDKWGRIVSIDRSDNFATFAKHLGQVR